MCCQWCTSRAPAVLLPPAKLILCLVYFRVYQCGSALSPCWAVACLCRGRSCELFHMVSEALLPSCEIIHSQPQQHSGFWQPRQLPAPLHTQGRASWRFLLVRGSSEDQPGSRGCEVNLQTTKPLCVKSCSEERAQVWFTAVNTRELQPLQVCQHTLDTKERLPSSLPSPDTADAQGLPCSPAPFAQLNSAAQSV